MFITYILNINSFRLILHGFEFFIKPLVDGSAPTHFYQLSYNKSHYLCFAGIHMAISHGDLKSLYILIKID